MLRMEGPEGWRLSGRAAVQTRSGFQPCSRHVEIGLAFILGLCLPRPSKAFFGLWPLPPKGRAAQRYGHHASVIIGRNGSSTPFHDHPPVAFAAFAPLPSPALMGGRPATDRRMSLWVCAKEVRRLTARLVELTLEELVSGIVISAFAAWAAGWLILRLFNPPPKTLRTKDWCRGWTSACGPPIALTGMATLAAYLPAKNPEINKYAAAATV